jgi:hypothetical protein
MKRRELSDDVVDETEADPARTVELLSGFNVGEYWQTTFTVRQPRNPQDTRALMSYIEDLKRAGLDIGKGDCQFGYKMPLPGKDAYQRTLQIFRRK